MRIFALAVSVTGMMFVWLGFWLFTIGDYPNGTITLLCGLLQLFMAGLWWYWSREPA